MFFNFFFFFGSPKKKLKNNQQAPFTIINQTHSSNLSLLLQVEDPADFCILLNVGHNGWQVHEVNYIFLRQFGVKILNECQVTRLQPGRFSLLNFLIPSVFFPDTLCPSLRRWGCSVTAGEGVTIPCLNNVSGLLAFTNGK